MKGYDSMKHIYRISNIKREDIWSIINQIQKKKGQISKCPERGHYNNI